MLLITDLTKKQTKKQYQTQINAPCLSSGDGAGNIDNRFDPKDKQKKQKKIESQMNGPCLSSGDGSGNIDNGFDPKNKKKTKKKQYRIPYEWTMS